MRDLKCSAKRHLRRGNQRARPKVASHLVWDDEIRAFARTRATSVVRPPQKKPVTWKQASKLAKLYRHKMKFPRIHSLLKPVEAKLEMLADEPAPKVARHAVDRWWQAHQLLAIKRRVAPGITKSSRRGRKKLPGKINSNPNAAFEKR